MALTKVLITVKTYPALSEKYEELVCTAGFREDGTWIRIYPVPFRKLDYVNQYKKWQWIEIDLVKNTSDFRPESYRPYSEDSAITILDTMGTENGWDKRKKITLNNIHYDLSKLIEKAKTDGDGTSLAIIKPKEVRNFIWEPCEREWNAAKLAKIEANQRQLNLFEETKKLFTVAKKLPYKFSYTFITEDNIERTLMIEDWELGQLYWNCLKSSNGDEELACKKVKEQYFDNFVENKNLHFFLGTTRQFHKIAPNPFIIIGAFYPPKEKVNQQLSLF
ncbi:hypothetical protein [Dysgonomonas mossii]|uniref:hypothetical protein n=1 Tax=Dysgonomonas mossii TaxID=163665 RepID=UPI003991B56E